MDETCRLRRGEGYVACIDEKQDKRMASEPTLFLVTTARSADCIRRLRRRCDWRLFGGNYARLASGSPQMQTIQSAIDGRLQLLEQRLSSLLFKQAVELDMGLSLLAECVNLDESVLRKQRAKSVNDVKRTNGQLRLEQKLRVQEPFDEWPD